MMTWLAHAAGKKNLQKQILILSTGQIAKDQEQNQRDVWKGFLEHRSSKQVSNYYVSSYDDGDHTYDGDVDHMMMVII